MSPRKWSKETVNHTCVCKLIYHKPCQCRGGSHAVPERRRMIINLTEGYYIEIDPLNHTLYQKYKGTAKDGSPKDGIRTIGYYGKLEHALERYLKLVQLDKIPNTVNTIPEYIVAIKTANKATVEEIRRMLDVKKERS